MPPSVMYVREKSMYIRTAHDLPNARGRRQPLSFSINTPRESLGLWIKTRPVKQRKEGPSCKDITWGEDAGGGMTRTWWWLRGNVLSPEPGH